MCFMIGVMVPTAVSVHECNGGEVRFGTESAGGAGPARVFESV